MTTETEFLKVKTRRERRAVFLAAAVQGICANPQSGIDIPAAFGYSGWIALKAHRVVNELMRMEEEAEVEFKKSLWETPPPPK